MLPPYVCTHIHIRTGTYTHNGKFQCGVFASRHFCTSQKLVHTHCNCAPSKSSNSVYPFSLKNFSYFHTYTHTNTCTGEQCTRQLQRYFFYKLNPYVRRYPLPHKHFPQRLLIWNYHFLQWKRSIVLGNGIQPPLVVFPYVFHRYSELYFLFFFSFFFLPFREICAALAVGCVKCCVTRKESTFSIYGGVRRTVIIAHACQSAVRLYRLSVSWKFGKTRAAGTVWKKSITTHEKPM